MHEERDGDKGEAFGEIKKAQRLGAFELLGGREVDVGRDALMVKQPPTSGDKDL